MKLKSHTLAVNTQSLYDVTESQGIVIPFIEIVNTGATTIYLNLCIRLQGLDYPILPVDYELQAGAKLEDDGVRFLPYGAQICGSATAANVAKVLIRINN